MTECTEHQAVYRETGQRIPPYTLFYSCFVSNFKYYVPTQLIVGEACFAGIDKDLRFHHARMVFMEEHSRSESGARSNAELAGFKVMVIDDSATIRRSAETMLSKEGCDVETAVDGFEALAKIAQMKPQLIFVDIMMPRLDGYQTCAIIKNNDKFKATPVVMLTSKDGLFDKARGRVVGSDQYLTKPFTRDELLSAVRRYQQT